jgi:hypothetical protein
MLVRGRSNMGTRPPQGVVGRRAVVLDGDAIVAEESTGHENGSRCARESEGCPSRSDSGMAGGLVQMRGQGETLGILRYTYPTDGPSLHGVKDLRDRAWVNWAPCPAAPTRGIR